MRVVGIDPGYGRCGIAVAERDATGKDVLLYSACLSPRAGGVPERLEELGEQIERVLSSYDPEVLALERLFFSANRKTALAVAEARGVMLALAGTWGMPVYEYTPQQVKVALTGYGRSSKEQVASMVRRLVPVRDGARLDDEFDAIAVALTHLATERSSGARR